MKNLKINISSERALSIILSPIMTEKSTNLNQYNKYSFFVSKKSNSLEIKQAIESIFKVKVLKINTLINIGKVKSFKGSIGNKKDQKKAIVTLVEGNSIDSSLEIK
jgi:large subunit ribosomal protein L23